MTFILQKRCQEINGYLLKIDNEKENTWVNERARKKGMNMLHLYLFAIN